MIEARDEMGFVPIYVTIKEEGVNSRRDTSSVSIFVVFPKRT